MPNWTEHVITVTGEPEDLLLFVDKHYVETKDDEEDSKTRRFDFDTIIPEPRKKSECPPEFIVASAAAAHIVEDDKRPWFNWYEWHLANWGTKWNACDSDCPTEDDIIRHRLSEINIYYNAAWSNTAPIIAKLQELWPQLKIEAYWKYEGDCVIGHMWPDGYFEEYDGDSEGQKEYYIKALLAMGYDEDSWEYQHVMGLDEEEDDE